MCVFVQGLGLYAARDIEKCTMVIEYIGTIIRSEVANRKERLYESQVTHTHTLQSFSEIRLLLLETFTFYSTERMFVSYISVIPKST